MKTILKDGKTAVFVALIMSDFRHEVKHVPKTMQIFFSRFFQHRNEAAKLTDISS